MPLEQGWNLVGNPFIVDAYVNRAFYKLNDNGSAIVPVISNLNEYVPTKTPACTGILVYAETSDETVTFFKDVPFTTTNDQGQLTITLTQANSRDNSTIDKAIVSFNEGDRLGKFYFGEQQAIIYIPGNHDEYSIIHSDRRSDVYRNVSEENDTFAYQNGDDIIVDGEGELQVFDVMGRLVASQRVNGVETIANPELSEVYVLKMNERTQKIVVR